MDVIKKHISFQTSYSETQWVWLKVPFIIVWFLTFSISLFRLSEITAPLGVCKFVDCSYFLSINFKVIFFISSLIASILYVLEKRMILSLSILTFCSVLIFTIEDSQGIFDRNDILSGILLAQLFAYILFSKQKSVTELRKKRIHYSQQVIVAFYFLSGLTKLMQSGISWGSNTRGFALQVYKSNLNKYIDFGNDYFLKSANTMVDFVVNNPILFSILLTTTLLIELSGILFIFLKPKWLILYGVLMIFVHIGIWFVMKIYITPIILVNLIFLIGFFRIFAKTNTKR